MMSVIGVGPQASSGGFGSYTWETRPSPAAVPAGTVALMTNIGPAPGTLMYNTGVYWRPVNGKAQFYVQVGESSTAANTDEQAFAVMVTFPIGFLQQWCVIQFRTTAVKTGTAGTWSFRTRMGSTGTTADNALSASTGIGATAVTLGAFQDFLITDITTARKLGVNNATPYGGASTTGTGANVTIADITTTANVMIQTAQMANGADSALMRGFVCEVVFP